MDGVDLKFVGAGCGSMGVHYAIPVYFANV